jgi:hypothetical protein
VVGNPEGLKYAAAQIDEALESRVESLESQGNGVRTFKM